MIKMKKMNQWSSLLLFALLMLSVSSCKQEDVAVQSATGTKELPSFAANISLQDIPVLAPEERTIVSTDTEDGISGEGQGARAFEYTVPAEGGNYPTLSFRDGDKIPVRILLYPTGAAYYGQKVFYSKGTVDLSVKDGKVSFSAKQVELVGGKYKASGQDRQLKFSGDLVMNNEHQWMMTAIYAPGSTASDNIISFRGQSPLKFLNAGDRLKVGQDINIPFVLGVKQPDGSYRPGVPVKMEANKDKIGFMHESNSRYNDPTNYSFEVKKTEGMGFYPLGTLFALRFSNDMKNLADLKSKMDKKYWNANNGNYEQVLSTYNYKVEKVTISSTTQEGTFDIGKSVSFTPSGLTRSSFVPQKEVNLTLDEAKTPWLYIWQYSSGGADNSALEITFNLYNKELGVHTLEKVYRAVGSKFKGSHKYYKHLKISRELRLPPLALFAPTFVSFIDNDLTWGNPWGSNAKEGNDHTERGVGRPYLAKEFFENNKRMINPFTIKSSSSSDQSDFDKDDTKWILPSEKEIKSIFPTSIKQLTVTDAGEPKRQIVGVNEDVVINGLPVQAKAYYYARENGKDITGKNQKDPASLRVYYALRYVGTQYVSAWRYIEWGRWNNNLNNSTDQPIASKFIIQSRSLPLSAGATGNKKTGFASNDQKAFDLLEHTIGTNEFWSDRVKNSDQLTIHNVAPAVGMDDKLLKPDVIQRIFPLVGTWYKGKRAYIGTAFNIWVAPENDKPSATRAYQVSNQDRPSLTMVNSLLMGSSGKAMVLPVLYPARAKN